MTNSRGLNFAHELTMEYIRQNNLLQCDEKDIPKQISKIVKIENIIVDSVGENFHNFKTL